MESKEVRDYKTALGIAIKAHRQTQFKNMSRDQAARLAKISRVTAWNIENGLADCRIGKIIAYQMAIKMTPLK